MTVYAYLLLLLCIYRSSRPEVFCKKGVLRNLTKFIGKHLCQNPFFNKVAGLRPATLLKKRIWHRSFPEFCQISKNTFLHRTPLVAASAVTWNCYWYIFVTNKNSSYDTSNDIIMTLEVLRYELCIKYPKLFKSWT